MLKHWTALVVLSYVHVVEPALTIDHRCKTVGELHVTLPTALNLCALQLYTSFDFIIELILEATLSIHSDTIEDH
jgi:hypothetical protein